MCRSALRRGLKLGIYVAALAYWGMAGVAHAVLDFDITQMGAGNGPNAVAVGSFNASVDAIQDLAIANADGNSIAIFLGTGTGFSVLPSVTLTGSGSYPLKSPQFIAVGDFNGDTFDDIAVSNYSGSSVSIFLGSGSGAFTQKPNVPVLSNPRGIAVGKFHGAANPLDIAVVTKTGTTTATGTGAGQVSILSGDGTGGFSRTDYPVGPKPRDIVVGDFGTSSTNPQLDTKLDVAVTCQGSSDKVHVLFGNGSGGFVNADNAAKFTGGGGPVGITSADLNGDGCPDLATTNDDSGVNRVYWFQGRCTQTTGDAFTGGLQIADFGSDANPFDIVVLNLNGDTKPDLAVTNTGTSGTSLDRVALLQNILPSTGNWPSSLCDPTSNAPMGLAAGLFSGDAITDLAVANRKSDNVSILTLDGTGSSCSVALVNQNPAKSPVALAACDVTNLTSTATDSNVDLLVLDKGTTPSEKVLIFAGDGAGNFVKTTLEVTVSGTTGTDIACGDIDGDGDNDITVVNNSNPGDVQKCVNNGGSSFSCSTLLAGLNSPRAIVIANLDGTSPIDFAVAASGSDQGVVLRPPNPTQLLATEDSPVSIDVGLFKTANLDLVVAPSTVNNVDVLFNNAGGVPGQFETVQGIGIGTKPGSTTQNKPTFVVSGEVNGDSRADIVTVNQAQSCITVVRGDPGITGAFLSALSFLVGSKPNSAVIADFDLDGRPDVAVADTSRNDVALALGDATLVLRSCAPGTAGCEFDAGSGPASIVTGMFNADTKPDIAVVDQAGGSITILLNVSTPPSGTGTGSGC
jgi:VCBS repeat protein/FG-GAP repeat protein